MRNGGLSQARLGRMHDALANYVARGEAPGLVTLVSRRGETYVDAIGAQASDGAPMRRDTIFRISSMTKPVTALATMALIEECKLRLDDQWIGSRRSWPIGASWLPNGRVSHRHDTAHRD